MIWGIPEVSVAEANVRMAAVAIFISLFIVDENGLIEKTSRFLQQSGR